jgi:outer membrane lipoprotein-sorting protein
LKTWLAAAAIVAFTGAAPASFADQAYANFDAAWAKVTSYTCTLTSHEVQGNKTQDRVYQLWFRKPVDTRMNVISGDDKGAEAAYQGGDRVKGHHGGFLSFLHLTLNIHNSQATSIRGTTIADANFEALVEHIRGLKTTNTDATVENGQTQVTVAVADPSTDQNVTREAMTFGPDGLPVEFDQWEGDTLVKHQTFTDVKLNVDIPDSQFNL